MKVPQPLKLAALVLISLLIPLLVVEGAFSTGLAHPGFLRRAAWLHSLIWRLGEVAAGPQPSAEPTPARAFLRALTTAGSADLSGDLSTVLTGDDYFILDDHITAEGHRKVAEAVLRVW